MTGKNLYIGWIKLIAMILLVAATPGIFAGTIRAEKINLTLEAAPLTILKSSSTTKRINGIPANTPGVLNIRIKWHAMTFVPNVFNKLKIELLHGATVLHTKECYSHHSDKEPKCFIYKSVSQTEAAIAGTWRLRITNNSSYDVNGFNIVKEITDLNPTVRSILSTFEPDCSTRNLLLQGGGRVDIAPYSSVERELYGIQLRPGEVHIRAKWHTDVITPNVFDRLKVEVLREGTVFRTDYGYSIHSNEKDKLNIRFNVGENQVGENQPGFWKLRITNEGGLQIKGFNIEKGYDLNPFVPNFTSTFKPCP